MLTTGQRQASADGVRAISAVRVALAVFALSGALVTAGTTAQLPSPPDLAFSTGERQALLRLRERRPPTPAPLFLITDPDKDPDDLVVLVLLRALRAEGLIDPRCVIATLGNRDTRRARAEFARAVLDSLGLGHVSVGVGRDYDQDVRDADGRIDEAATAARRRDHAVRLSRDLATPTGGVVADDGGALFRRELARVADHTAVVVVNAGMSDVAALFTIDGALVARKVARVVVMGGVLPAADAGGRVVPDARAYNHTTDQDAAVTTYAYVQSLGIPLVVVTREAAYAAAVPRRFYDRLAATGHPLGERLRAQQRQSLEQLWNGIRTGELPPALTLEWFLATFAGVGAGTPEGRQALVRAEREGFDDVWPQVSRFNLYDPLALLAATPGTSEILFRPSRLRGVTSDVRIIDGAAIGDAALLADVLGGFSAESLRRP